MEQWTKQELDDLVAKMTKKAMTDMAFRKEVLQDAASAMEKLAGRPLPEGMTLKAVEKDPNYQTTLVLPDFVDEEKISDDDLENVAGGTGLSGTFPYIMGEAFPSCSARMLCAADQGGHSCTIFGCYKDENPLFDKNK